jgi:hypothetical protein
VGRAAENPTAGLWLAAVRTRAVRTDLTRPAWDRIAMTRYRKRKALDLFFEALVHPVRFR